MWQELWVVLALMLVLEGIIPFLSPNLMRRALLAMANTDNRTMRVGGFVSMMFGIILLYIVKQ